MNSRQVSAPVAGDAPAAGSAALVEALTHAARTQADPAVCDWIEQVVARSPFDAASFALAFATATRRAGKRTLALGAGELDRLRAAGAADFPAAWTLDGLVRALLLVRAAALTPPSAFYQLVEECYARGDNRERRAVLRALALLPQPERFVPLAAEACRSSIQPIFEAVACENPYPAAYFPEPNFNQMVLKALFTGAALPRIIGLTRRITPELRRMAADYAGERRAAGRSVPPDIEWLLRQTPV